MTNQIPFNRLQILTCLAVLMCVTILVLSILTLGMISAKTPYRDLGFVSLYWLIQGSWVGLCAYIARDKFRSWAIVVLCGFGMIIWFTVGAGILAIFPDLVMFLLFGSGWIERIATDDTVNAALETTVGMLPFFIVISMIWGLFPMLLASWSRRKNIAHPALA